MATPALAYRVSPAHLRVSEPPRDPLDEATLSRIWAAQSFPSAALSLADGRPLRIVLPGRPGGGAGPDYRDAIVAIDSVELRGDIELHVRASSFYAHGHHRDAAYDNVVLHVAYLADDGPSTLLSSGRRTPVAHFAPWLRQRAGQLEQWLAAPPLWQEPCSDAVPRLGREGVLTALSDQGRHRFETRVARLAESVAAVGEEQALWQALLDALGHGGDRAAWRRLAGLLPASVLASFTAGLPPDEGAALAEAALIATAGLAEPPSVLTGLLPRPLSPPLPPGSRPANRPQRRLRALARLWQRAGGDIPSFARASVDGAKDLRDLTGRWTVADPNGGPALLGEQRARELLLNAVLPFAALEDGPRGRAFQLADALPPAPPYGKTAFLDANLRRGDDGLRVKTAMQQQGLLAMVAEWCRPGGCGRCPLS